VLITVAGESQEVRQSLWVGGIQSVNTAAERAGGLG